LSAVFTVWAVLVMAMGRSVFGSHGPFLTCQKCVGRFGLGRFGRPV